MLIEDGFDSGNDDEHLSLIEGVLARSLVGGSPLTRSSGRRAILLAFSKYICPAAELYPK